jgi:hypothetical protein
MDYLALALFCKDENFYLDEWLTYHSALGVNHFFIIDNNSKVPLAETVREWERSGVVTVSCNNETSTGRQCRAYANVLREYGRRYTWIGFIDTDEFLVPKIRADLPSLLEGYEKFGGLGVFWNCFGSNGHKTQQPSVIKAFTRRAFDEWPKNSHIKSIVQPQYTIPEAAGDPHHFIYSKGYYCVDENGVRIDGARRWPRASEKVQLNHYVTRSEEECRWKVQKSSGNEDYVTRDDTYFETYDRDCNQIEDTRILKVVN